MINHRDTETQGKNVDLNVLSGQIIDCAIQIHKELGPGLLESLYEEAMCYELEQKSLRYEKQKFLHVPYKSIILNSVFKLDLVVENSIILELKTVERILPVHEAQLLTYLKITNIKLGLILNFNEHLMKQGIRRIIH